MSQIDLKKIIDFSYLTNRQPDPNSELIFFLSIVFGALILASGIAWLVFIRREQTQPVLTGLRRRLVRWLFTSGFVGLFLIFFRATGIPFLGMRLWLLLWLLASLGWFVTVCQYLLKTLPKERSLYQEQQLRDRYLPKARNAAR